MADAVSEPLVRLCIGSYGSSMTEIPHDDPARPTTLRLSVLDQSPVPEGAVGGEALRHSVDLARLADRLGYHRYWVAEHHGTPGLACASPEVLIGPIAAATSRIRVGSGGVMLPHYSPLKVAENFSMLSGLYPGRIDMGLGRAAGTDPKTTFALQRDRRQVAPDDFPNQLDELLAYLEDRLPEDHPFARLAEVLPGRPNMPQCWLLGSSQQSAIWAAERGLPYAFADFINAAGAPFASLYRDSFKPVRSLVKPQIAVAVWAICAESDQAAQELTASFRMMMSLLHRGQFIAVPPVEKAMKFLAEEGGPLGALTSHRRIIAGAPATVRRGIEAVAREYGAEEVLIVNILYDHAARRRSYELIADELQLTRESIPRSTF
jgi:luciferase family oxidoreductase group 1